MMRQRASGWLLRVVAGLVAGAVSAAASGVTPRNLARDEAWGGHTLARHVGRTAGQLGERLERERGISAASSYTDQATAERVVAEALARSADRVREWTSRRGRRPNLALHYRGQEGVAIGTSLARGARRPRPCVDAVVVLRWDERRDDFFVLTSYPEDRR